MLDKWVFISLEAEKGNYTKITIIIHLQFNFNHQAHFNINKIIINLNL